MSAVALDRDERLDALFMPVRDMSSVMGAVVVGSIILHAALVGTAFVSGRAPPETPKEIAVEIVQEAPKPTPAKPPEPVKAERVASEQVEHEPAKLVPRAQAEPQAKAELPAHRPVPPPKARDAALQKELDSLRAEQAALKSQLAQAEAMKSPIPSDKAIALAAADEAGGDPVGYQQLVFSQLAKAKDETAALGGVGTTAVRFEIATTGALAGVEVVTPSGDADLDRAALAIVRRAAPFPPPPKDAERIVFANVNFIPPKRP